MSNAVAEFFVVANEFNDLRGPGPKQWTVVLDSGSSTAVDPVRIRLYSPEALPFGAEFVLVPRKS